MRGIDERFGTLDEDIFFQWQDTAQKCRDTAEGARSALVHFQMSKEVIDGWSCGDSTWAQDATIIKAVNGFEFRGGRKKTVIPRGMITKEMVFELLELIRVNDPILFLPVAIIFFVAMRISEFTLMTTLDLTYCEEHSQWNILVHSNKHWPAGYTRPNSKRNRED